MSAGEAEELERLRAENAELRMERDVRKRYVGREIYNALQKTNPLRISADGA